MAGREAARTRLGARTRIADGRVALITPALLLALSLREDRAMSVSEAAGSSRLWAWVRTTGGSVPLVSAPLLLADILHEDRAMSVREAAGAGRRRARIRSAAGCVALVRAPLLLTLRPREDRAVTVREAAGAHARIRIAGGAVAPVAAALVLALERGENRAMSVREAAGAGRSRAWVWVAVGPVALEAAPLLLALSLRLLHAVAVRVTAGAGRRLRAGVRIAVGSGPPVCAPLLLALSLREDRAMSVREAAGADHRALERRAGSVRTLECPAGGAAILGKQILASAVRKAASTQLQRTRTLILTLSAPDDPTEVVAVVDQRRVAIVRPLGMVVTVGVVRCADARSGAGSGHRKPVHLEEPAVHRDAEGTGGPRARSGPRGIRNLEDAGTARCKVRVVVRRNVTGNPNLERGDAGAGVVREGRDHPDHRLDARVPGDVRDQVRAGRW